MKASNNKQKLGPENPTPLRSSSARQDGSEDHKPSERIEPIQEAPEMTPSALVTRMSCALSARQRKTPWVGGNLRAEMLRRYADVLTAPTDTPLRDFVRWVVDEARYLAAEANFQLFCHAFLASELDQTRAIWAWAVKGEN